MAARKSKDRFEQERSIFREYIRSLGLRRTSQRELIMEIFLKTEEHLTIDALHWLVQKEDASIGHTTVYRTLKLLTEAGLAREVHFGDNRTYYEHHFNHAHHDHLICTECGTVVEFVSPEIEDLQDQVAEAHGFRPTHHSLRLWGICGDCRKAEVKATVTPPGAQPRVKVRSSIGH
ncbi:MAG: transcriptional repressor [Chloracidobacterium sp.]|nr:transcriptional repressor [Chloracidobacterium sp.]MCO5334368.1 transcriptional repressor [Pyrinomonadaceae bacterium]